MRQSGFTLVALVVYDAAVQEYSPPFFARTVDEGVRIFEFMLDDKESTLAKRPGDYRLFLAGQYHRDTGVLEPYHGGPVLIEQALELVKDRPTSKVVLNPGAEEERNAFMERFRANAKLIGKEV